MTQEGQMLLLKETLTKKHRSSQPDQRQSYYLLSLIDTLCATSKPEHAEDLADMTF